MARNNVKTEQKHLDSFKNHPLAGKFMYNHFLKKGKNNIWYVNITCKVCGKTYERRCNRHARGQDCPCCVKLKQAQARKLNPKGKLTLQDCITRIEDVHGKDAFHIYDIERRGGSIYIHVNCKRCERDSWWVDLQTLTKGSGCKECYYASLRISDETWFERFKQHPSADTFIVCCLRTHNKRRQGLKICLECSTIRWLDCDLIWTHTCKKCVTRKRAKQRIGTYLVSDETWLKRLKKKKHVEQLIILGFKSKHNKRYVQTKCKKAGHICWTQCSVILKGTACKKCDNIAKRPLVSKKRIEKAKNSLEKKTGLTYIIKCTLNKEKFYKIGHTKHNTTHKRYEGKSQMPYTYEILHEIPNNLYLVNILEWELQQHYKPQSYEPLVYFRGHTECFSELPNIETILEQKIKQLKQQTPIDKD